MYHYIHNYNVNFDKTDILDTAYSKSFRFTIFGLPLVSAKQKKIRNNIAYKIYLFDTIPIFKLFLTKS